jgi:hypothetical protein
MVDEVGGLLQMGRTVLLKLIDSLAKNYYIPSICRREDVRKIIGISNQTAQIKDHWFFRSFIITHLEEQERMDDGDEADQKTQLYSVDSDRTIEWDDDEIEDDHYHPLFFDLEDE